MVREINLESNQFGREWRADSKLPLPHPIELHGGSSPILHDGLMWRVVHHYDQGKDGNRERCYSIWLMAFDAVPPFSPRWFCTRPILKGERLHEEPLTGWRDWLVVFCATLERVSDGWRFYFGHNDRRMRWGTVMDEQIEPFLADLRCTPPSEGQYRSDRAPMHSIR